MFFYLILKKKLELLAYRAYSRILFQTGRKLEVYEILKEQIDFLMKV